MLVWQILTVPLLSALIGWVTNVAAVRLLFWPLRPLRLGRGILGRWSLQGVLPRRQAEIAQALGEAFEEKLLSSQDLAALLNGGPYEAEAAEAVARYLRQRVDGGLPRFLPHGVRVAITDYVGDLAQRESRQVVTILLTQLQGELRDRWHPGELVARKLAGLDVAQFEGLLLKVIGRELRWLEWLGAIMGFVIGLIQLALVLA